ncbi:hypothetical protein PLESTB_000132600 [Pleodorina starrii]|uniref:Uncharacterized protein n=1 Tax=Pleodorina starrii TaxID=330485 RepID=A0A9W6EXB2_9CHLO|nr:hypothetical protein PLESTB_000132600 [Pleodorina starrii]
MERLERRADTGAPSPFHGGSRPSGTFTETDGADNRASLDRRDAVPGRSSGERRSLDRNSVEGTRRSREHHRTSREQQRRSREEQRRSREEQRRSQEHQRGSRDGPGGPRAAAAPAPTPAAAAPIGVEASGNSWTVTHRRNAPGGPPPAASGGGDGATVAAAAGRSSTDAGGGGGGGSSLWTASASPTPPRNSTDVGGRPSTDAAGGAGQPQVQSAAGGRSGLGPTAAAAPVAAPGRRLAVMASITEDDLLAAASALAAVEVATAAPPPRGGPPPDVAAGGEEARAGRGDAAGGGDAPRQRGVPAPAPQAPSSPATASRRRPDSAASDGDMRVGAEPSDGSRTAARGPGQPYADAAGSLAAKTPAPDHPGPRAGGAAEGAGGCMGGGGAAGSLAALGLVEVEPLCDHIQRDEERSVSHPRASDASAAAARAGEARPGRPEGAPRGPPRGGAGERTLTNETMATYEDFGDLARFSLPRQWAIRLCANPDFEMVVTAIIFANCITLCLFDPRQPEHQGTNQKLFWAGESPAGLGRVGRRQQDRRAGGVRQQGRCGLERARWGRRLGSSTEALLAGRRWSVRGGERNLGPSTFCAHALWKRHQWHPASVAGAGI